MADIWTNVLQQLKKDLSETTITTWFDELEAVDIRDNTFYLYCPNDFKKRYIESLFFKNIKAVLLDIFSVEFDVRILDDDQLAEFRGGETHTGQSERFSSAEFTFDTFVVGNGNRFAHAASLAVAESPAEAYNPLFIYGGVGLGKTHLMNAIGNYTLARDPRKNVLFISSETFTNEFIDALAKKKGTSDLRDRMRSVDVLMVDDIQFLSKTVATQEEFFHTFNDLHAKGKQIILSSDRPPREIPTIEDRLRSRFEWGLIVDIRRPDFETRMAILQRKCEDDGVDCDPEVLEFIAGRVKSNIRELEGALNRLIAKHQLIGGRIDLAFAQETLDAILPVNAARAVNAQTILAAVAERYAVTSEDLLSKKRTRDLTLPRQIAMYMIRDMTSLSTTAIGGELGGRDHTTVMHGCDQIARMLQADPTLRKNLDDLKESLLKG